MACTVRYIILFLLITASNVYAAVVVYDLDDNNLVLKVSFNKGYSNVNTLKLDKSYVVSFETTEEVEFDQDFWDMPLKRVYVTTDGTRKRMIAEFQEGVIVPEVMSQEGEMKITFPFPKAISEKPTVTKDSYGRIIWGLLIVLCFILIIFGLIKKFYKKQILSDIPGTGRLLGRADIDIRKSLYFYEIDEVIYIIGVTETSMNLIDKINGEDEVNRIKSGFAKKADFGSYMNFFKKSPDIKEDVDISRNTINERLESLKKR
ncbi:MAG: hypothetical protein C0602_05660 [Denitrovibrio sp.]|nr:MAG: hypothetical protein C0602_05660 [Denitrovibrio sp.]